MEHNKELVDKWLPVLRTRVGLDKRFEIPVANTLELTSNTVFSETVGCKEPCVGLENIVIPCTRRIFSNASMLKMVGIDFCSNDLVKNFKTEPHFVASYPKKMFMKDYDHLVTANVLTTTLSNFIDIDIIDSFKEAFNGGMGCDKTSCCGKTNVQIGSFLNQIDRSILEIKCDVRWRPGKFIVLLPMIHAFRLCNTLHVDGIDSITINSESTLDLGVVKNWGDKPFRVIGSNLLKDDSFMLVGFVGGDEEHESMNDLVGACFTSCLPFMLEDAENDRLNLISNYGFNLKKDFGAFYKFTKIVKD